jgi:hypothetical protein
MAVSKDFEKKVKLDVLRWSAQHPIDFLWREHFNIPFGSEQHLNTTFYNQRFWFEERELFEMIREAKDVAKGIEAYMDGNGLLNRNGGVQLSESKIDDKFENLDYSKFSEKKTNDESEDKEDQ